MFSVAHIGSDSFLEVMLTADVLLLVQRSLTRWSSCWKTWKCITGILGCVSNLRYTFLIIKQGFS